MTLFVFLPHLYHNVEEYDLNKERKTLITFYYMIANMLSNKKLNPIVTELFIRIKKLNIFPVFFFTKLCFAVPKILD